MFAFLPFDHVNEKGNGMMTMDRIDRTGEHFYYTQPATTYKPWNDHVIKEENGILTKVRIDKTGEHYYYTQPVTPYKQVTGHFSEGAIACNQTTSNSHQIIPQAYMVMPTPYSGPPFYTSASGPFPSTRHAPPAQQISQQTDSKGVLMAREISRHWSYYKRLMTLDSEILNSGKWSREKEKRIEKLLSEDNV